MDNECHSKAFLKITKDFTWILWYKKLVYDFYPFNQLTFLCFVGVWFFIAFFKVLAHFNAYEHQAKTISKEEEWPTTILVWFYIQQELSPLRISVNYA